MNEIANEHTKKLKNRNARPLTGYLTSLIYILSKVFNSIASVFFKIEHFEFLSFMSHDIKMAVRGLSCMLTKCLIL